MQLCCCVRQIFSFLLRRHRLSILYLRISQIMTNGNNSYHVFPPKTKKLPNFRADKSILKAVCPALADTVFGISAFMIETKQHCPFFLLEKGMQCCFVSSFKICCAVLQKRSGLVTDLAVPAVALPGVCTPLSSWKDGSRW